MSIHKPLTTGQSLAYCAGDVGNNFVYQFASAFLLIFYTDVFGISPIAASTLFLVARVWDAINDPITGMFIDRTNSRWGRFRPWILFASVPCAVFSVAMFTVPSNDWSESSKLIYVYVTYIGFGMAYTALNLPYLSMVAVLSEDSKERTKLLALRQALAMIAAVSLAAVPVVLEQSTSDNPYQQIAIVFSSIALVLWLTCFFKTRERINIAEKEAAEEKPKVSAKAVLASLISNKPFLILAMVFFLLWGQMAISTASGMYIFTYYLNATSSLSVYMLSQILMVIVGIISVRKLINRFDKKWLFVIGMGVSSFRFAGLLTQDMSVIIGLGAIGSYFMGLCVGTVWGFVPDIIEYGEKQSGLRIDGISNAVIGFFWKAGFALGGLVPGVLLEAYGYMPNQEQTETAMRGLAHLGVTAPTVLGFACTLIMVFYPLTHKNREALGLTRVEA